MRRRFSREPVSIDIRGVLRPPCAVEGRDPDLLDRHAANERIPLDRAQLDEALADKKAFIGAAEQQVADVVAAAQVLIERYPDAAKYTPAPIL